MRYAAAILIVACLLATGPWSLSSQQEPQARRPLYDPAGRRDPFLDMLDIRQSQNKSVVNGITEMSIADVGISGIVETRGKLTAIITGPEGLPFYIKEGDKFSDGFVLSIGNAEVIFRKINERGIPLKTPKDVVKKINLEGR